jgi:hypothetical protein
MPFDFDPTRHSFSPLVGVADGADAGAPDPIVAPLLQSATGNSCVPAVRNHGESSENKYNLLPTVAELVHRAIELELGCLRDCLPLSEADAANAVDAAADTWADQYERAVPLAICIAARISLLREADMALEEGIQSGDLDHDGQPIPYDRYRNA